MVLYVGETGDLIEKFNNNYKAKFMGCFLKLTFYGELQFIA